MSFGENDEHLKNNAIVGGYVGKFLVKKLEEPHQRKQKIQLENDTVEESPAKSNNDTTNNNNVKVELSANDTKNIEKQEAVAESNNTTIVKEELDASSSNSTAADDENATLTGNNATNVPAAPFIYENWNAVPGSGVAAYPVV